MPAVLGALLVFPVYFIGKEMGGKSCGFVSAMIVAVLPGQIFSRTTLGFTDHHGAEILLSTLTMMFLLMAVRSGKSMTFAGRAEGLVLIQEPAPLLQPWPVSLSAFTSMPGHPDSSLRA